jgi:ankyrin repeat protein
MLLREAATKGSVAILEWLTTGQPRGVGLDIKLQADNQRSVLHHAVYYGNLEIVQYLVVEQKGEIDINGRDSYGKRPLDLALAYQNWEVVLCLLKNGASATDKDFIEAAKWGQLEVCQCLVEETKIDINCQGSENGETAALMVAAMNGRLDVLEWLLEKGALVTQDILPWLKERSLCDDRWNVIHKKCVRKLKNRDKTDEDDLDLNLENLFLDLTNETSETTKTSETSETR